MASVDPKYIKSIKGREFVVFEGLLDLAHQDGLNLIETELIQHPTEENGFTAITHARVRTDRGTFSGIGDASPANVREHIAPHLVRMSETRAIARGLRWGTNVAQCSEVEMGEIDTGTSNGHPTDHQIDRINKLAQHPGLAAEDLANLEEKLPRMTESEAADLIAILEAKTQQAINGNGHPEPAPGTDEAEGTPSDEPSATPKQVALINKTLDVDGDVLTEQESKQISDLLSGELSKRKASDLLDFLLGQSAKNPVSGAWEKVSAGVIKERRGRRAA
jgi:hypothetical protein